MTTEEEKNIPPEGWLERGKWTKFLMSLPLGKPRTFPIDDYRLSLIRITASGISNNEASDRRFTIILDRETMMFTITANKKQDDQAN